MAKKQTSNFRETLRMVIESLDGISMPERGFFPAPAPAPSPVIDPTPAPVPSPLPATSTSPVDYSSATCNGQPLTSEFVDALDALMSSAVKIEETCSKLTIADSTVNDTLVECLDLAIDFKSDLADCSDKSLTASATATCLDTIGDTVVEDLKNCIKTTKPLSTESRTNSKVCIKEVLKAKKAEDASVGLVYACSSEETVSSAVTGSTTGAEETTTTGGVTVTGGSTATGTGGTTSTGGSTPTGETTTIGGTTITGDP